jgi:hypothetical protein
VQRGEEKFNTYCGSCHIVPSPQDLPKDLWVKKVLPEMGARLGIYLNGYNPMKDMSEAERTLVSQGGFYPATPILSKEDWDLLYNYVVSQAPLKLPEIEKIPMDTNGIIFKEIRVMLDQKNGALTTYIDYNNKLNSLIIGNAGGVLFTWSQTNGIEEIAISSSAIVGFESRFNAEYLLEMGQMTPTELPSGVITQIESGKKSLIKGQLHRPVYFQIIDLNGDGKEEILISEFGYYNGQLALFRQNEDGKFEKSQLLGIPGIMKTTIEDMNGDGLLDIVAMAAQGDEGMYVLYQKENMTFNQKRILRFSSVYGSSWYELIDFDHDGDKDLITVNGDNADYSYTLKPYHGVRIFLNEGNDKFKQIFFQPLPGATRVVARDFDQDGDIDMGITCFFPDYDNQPEASFVYFENSGEEELSFVYKTIPGSVKGRWLVAEAEDYDKDGDDDIILGSFTYAITSVPAEIMKDWQSENLDILILENQLK